MADSQVPKSRKAVTITLTVLALGFVRMNSWPHPRGIYGTDYGWPLTLTTGGSAAHFDLLALNVDLAVALDVLILVGSILSPSIRRLALFWIPIVVIQLIIAGLIGLLFLFIHR